MTIERWRNSETGELYEVEYADGAVVPIEKARKVRKPKTTPGEPSGAVVEPYRHPEAFVPEFDQRTSEGIAEAEEYEHRLTVVKTDPKRLRMLAGLMRRVLTIEDPDDAA